MPENESLPVVVPTVKELEEQIKLLEYELKALKRLLRISKNVGLIHRLRKERGAKPLNLRAI